MYTFQAHLVYFNLKMNVMESAWLAMPKVHHRLIRAIYIWSLEHFNQAIPGPFLFHVKLRCISITILCIV